MSTELFLTFPAPALKGVTIIPLNSEETSGRFRVWLTLDQKPTPILVWDRKVEGKFPELKELVSPPACRSTHAHFRYIPRTQKQRIRDHIQPGKSLGHSDKK